MQRMYIRVELLQKKRQWCSVELWFYFKKHHLEQAKGATLAS